MNRKDSSTTTLERRAWKVAPMLVVEVALVISRAGMNIMLIRACSKTCLVADLEADLETSVDFPAALAVVDSMADKEGNSGGSSSASNTSNTSNQKFVSKTRCAKTIDAS